MCSSTSQRMDSPSADSSFYPWCSSDERSRIIASENILLDLTAPSYPEAVKLMVQLLADHHFLDQPADCLEIWQKHEQKQSSLYEPGFALPHFRHSSVRQLSSAIAIAQLQDVSQTVLIILTASPQTDSVSYLNYLSTIARLLQTPGITPTLLACQSADQLRQMFLQ